MSEFFKQIDPSIAPMSDREKTRVLRLQIWLWGKQFAARLKTNAQRMKQFLHARS